MPIFHLFNLSPAQYCEQFKSLVIPRPKCCPFCQAIHSFHRHGVYWRYVLDGQQEQQYVPIPRFLCRVCRHTLSILPAFVIPFFQYSVPVILSTLRTWFLKRGEQLNIPAACLRFWRQRFISFSEKFDALKQVLKYGLLRRGIPKMIYVDNGKIYHAEQLHLACASDGLPIVLPLHFPKPFISLCLR